MRIKLIIKSYEGAKKYRKIKDANDNVNDINDHHEFMHGKVSKLWQRRFRLAFCCLTKAEYGDEAFSQTAELFSNLFNGTDLVPTGNYFIRELVREFTIINQFRHNGWVDSNESATKEGKSRISKNSNAQ